MTTGERIATLRKKNGITQEQLAPTTICVTGILLLSRSRML